MAETTWEPRRSGMRFVVERRKWSDGFGSAYEFAREAGKVQRFWTRQGAQAYADSLNSKEPTP